MPNAKDEINFAPNTILALGIAGSGKTTQFLTLPGKKFNYIFDPNALRSLQGYDVDYELFLPSNVPINATSLSKDKPGDKVSVNMRSTMYRTWEEDFEKKLKSGFFDQYDVIGIDSSTTLLDLIMDRLLAINGRSGAWPQQDDWGPQMVIFVNIMRTFTALGKLVYVTGHLDVRKDKLTEAILRVPLMTGTLKTKIPILFSDIFVFDATSDGKHGANYTMQTVPDRRTASVRTSIKGLKPVEDITIDWTKDPVGQGLGGLLRR